MEINKTYRLRGYVKRVGKERIESVLEETRLLYNGALLERKGAWEHSRQRISKKDQQNTLTLIRQDIQELSELSIQVLREPLRRIDKAYQSFFKRCKKGMEPGYPRFKPASRWNSIGVAEAVYTMLKRQLNGKYLVKIKGLPNIEVRSNRELPDSKQLKGIRIFYKASKLFVCLTFKEEVNPLPVSNRAVGIDMGINKRVTLSDGRKVESVKQDLSRYKKLQSKLNKAVKGSNNRRKKKAALSRESYRLMESRKQATHRLTSGIVKESGFIALEDLQVKNMSKSAKGTIENPGKQVSQKRGLNRSIIEQSWGMIREQLTYKAEWAGRAIEFVDPKYTSQTCSGCGVISKGNRKGEVYHCSSCGLKIDADYNASLNILRLGLIQAGEGLFTPGRAVECLKPS